MSTTIRTGQTLKLDPADIVPILVDWDDEALPALVTIVTSTFTITTLQQLGLTILTKDSESIPAGNRTTQLRLNATTATLGDKYRVNNKIVTNETPARTVERSFHVWIVDQ